MDDYIDLCFVRYDVNNIKSGLFEAPAFDAKVGEKVMLPDGGVGIVEAVKTCEKGGEDYDLLLKVTGTKELLRLKGYITYQDYDYREEEKA